MEMTKNLYLEMKNIIECPICTETLKNSRVLPCLHTFCLKCLILYGKEHKSTKESVCPVCRSAFAVPEGGHSNLKKNFFIDKLIEAGTVLQDQQRSALCEMCEDQPGKVAKFHCEACAESMCEQCYNVHGRMKMSKSHKVTTISNEDNLNLEAWKPSTCEQHEQEIKFYCLDCNKVACSKCLSDQHIKHRSSEVKSVTEELRNNVKRDCDEVKVLLNNAQKKLRNSNEMLADFQKTAVTAERNITERGEAIKRYVDKNVSLLLGKMRAHKLRIEEDFKKVTEEIERNKSVLEGLQKYCEEIIQKADINDLLLVKDDIKTRVCGLIKKTDTKVDILPVIDFISSDYPITDDDDRIRNSQNNIIGSVCVSRGMYKSIQGLTASDDELFVVLNKSSDIHVYDVQTLTYRRRIPVPRLMDPCDIAYIKQILFVSESEEQLVHIIKLPTGRITTRDVCGRMLKLSVNRAGNVLVSSFDPPIVAILTPENYSHSSTKVQHKAYSIANLGSCLHHAVGLDEKFWAAAFVKNPPSGTPYVGKKNIPAMHKIDALNMLGSISVHDQDYREVELMLDLPCYLELYDHINMHVLAADHNNNRIVKIDFNTMKIVDVVLPAWTGLVRPFTFCLNNRHDNIYVVDNRNQILMFDLDCKRSTSADNGNAGKLFGSEFWKLRMSDEDVS